MPLRLSPIAGRFAGCLAVMAIAIAALVAFPAEMLAQQSMPLGRQTEAWQAENYAEPSNNGAPYGEQSYAPENGYACEPGVGYRSTSWWPGWTRLGIRHSSTYGRASGSGRPLRGTSWLNRPYEFGIETGAFLMTKRIGNNTRRNNDLMLAGHLGWDWDHYWGSQLRVGWTTPDLTSSAGTTQRNSNNLLMYDVSMMYYPWGDSQVRPYYRLGLGLTSVSFITPSGVIEDDTLFSIPVAIGIKYQTKRWMTFRAELADYITYGQNSAAGTGNLTLTFGVDWRFGGRPSGSWSSPTQRRAW